MAIKQLGFCPVLRLVSLSEAVRRIVPLIDGLSDLAGLRVLEGVFDWQEAEKRGRRLLVRLIHERILLAVDNQGKPLAIWFGGDARWACRLYDLKTKNNNYGSWRAKEYEIDEIFLESEPLAWLLDLLGPKPTLFLDWQLAYAWAGKEMPSARRSIISQQDPPDIPPNIGARLTVIRRFIPSPTDTPTHGFPLFEDGSLGRGRLYSWDGFIAFIQDNFPRDFAKVESFGIEWSITVPHSIPIPESTPQAVCEGYQDGQPARQESEGTKPGEVMDTEETPSSQWAEPATMAGSCAILPKFPCYELTARDYWADIIIPLAEMLYREDSQRFNKQNLWLKLNSYPPQEGGTSLSERDKGESKDRETINHKWSNGKVEAITYGSFRMRCKKYFGDYIG
ncbi:hypothetical protein [Methylomagnum ishizawai]|uniref:hypothetical protein n=1 Tax=Methylomagnum ishizawai TaxID=1760988 RepID=UPI000F738727|nr:hypothetical protein [Methylomagnum ishizawai]